MGPDRTTASDDHPEVLFQWSARKVPPIVLLYVAIVFVAFIAVSYFGFHSMTAVKALAMAAVAGIIPLIPTVLQRVEYRFTEQRLDRRTVAKDKAKEFEVVFRLDELSHIVPVQRGFKFYRPLDESNVLRRFWKLHVSDEYSGEVYVEPADRERVMAILDQSGIPARQTMPWRRP